MKSVLKHIYRSLIVKQAHSKEPLMYRGYLFNELVEKAGTSNFAGKTILEIGPKDGLDSKRLISLNPKELVMIDLPEKTEANNKWLATLTHPHRYIEGNFMYMPQNEIVTLGTFDLIWCTGVLYHNAEQMRLLRKMYKLLNVGGYFVLESATLRRGGALKNGCFVEIHYPQTYRNTGTVTHLPTANAIKAWLTMVGFKEIQDSKCYYHENRQIVGQRYACICRKTDNDECGIYYGKSGLNPQYRFGDSI
jgi:2-polyprenyl-3-methyl-5-hydroxy-6-metoxy-1,4-benzoquinol methylase